MQKRKIILAVTGASGAIYARQLMDEFRKLKDQLDEVAIVFSSNADDIWRYELGSIPRRRKPFKGYANTDFYAPFASGSSTFDTLIICPCSMGMLGRIAHGVSDDLITRAADVMLKERRKLILVPRETPYNLIHIENMATVTRAGGMVCPATPSFYSKPQNIEELAATVTHRILQLAGFPVDSYRWNE